jgi:hypothetical protein
LTDPGAIARRKQYHVSLTPAQRAAAQTVLDRGTAAALTHRHARILLEADAAVRRRVRSDAQVAALCGVSPRTVARVRERFARDGFAVALHGPTPPRIGSQALPRAGGAPHRPGLYRATGGSGPLERAAAGRAGGRAGGAATRQPRTGAHHAQKNRLKPWRVRRWLIPPQANAAFVAAMEDVLAVYARPPDPRRPLVCFDEAGKDLKAHTHPPQPAAPGRVGRYDSHYARAGSRNLFLACAPHLGWRQIAVTDHRTAIDFAHAVRDLVDRVFPGAERIVLVTDNLNTHRPAALYQAFPPAEAWRILHRLEWHYTPTHGSWLNMAELELSVLTRQCLARRIPDQATLETEVAAWVAARNAERLTTAWHFTQEQARSRLPWLYPCHE